jgi:hypothetical protein
LGKANVATGHISPNFIRICDFQSSLITSLIDILVNVFDCLNSDAYLDVNMSLVSANQVWIIGHDLSIVVYALVAPSHINIIHYSPTSIFRVAIFIDNSLIGEELRKSLRIRE